MTDQPDQSGDMAREELQDMHVVPDRARQRPAGSGFTWAAMASLLLGMAGPALLMAWTSVGGYLPCGAAAVCAVMAIICGWWGWSAPQRGWAGRTMATIGVLLGVLTISFPAVVVLGLVLDVLGACHQQLGGRPGFPGH